MKAASSHHALPLILQGVLAICAIAAIALMPPRAGAILIVSMNGQSRGEIARWAIAHQARLVGAGPFAHSLVVMGDRGALLGEALGQRALLLPGPAAGCGDGVPA